MTDTLSPIGFWSYARQDDEEKLSGLRSILQRQLQQKYGREPIKIFQDVAAIPPGADWNNKITEALHSSTFLIPIITPNFLESEWCNQEFFLFLEREQAIAAEFPELAASRRIFPIFYIDITDVEAFNEQLLPKLRERQWTNFRDLIYKEDTHESVRLRLDQIAESIVKVLRQDQRAVKERKLAAEASQAAAQQAASQRQAEEVAAAAQQAAAEKRAREAEALRQKQEAERIAAETERRSRDEAEQKKQVEIPTTASPQFAQPVRDERAGWVPAERLPQRASTLFSSLATDEAVPDVETKRIFPSNISKHAPQIAVAIATLALFSGVSGALYEANGLIYYFLSYACIVLAFLVVGLFWPTIDGLIATVFFVEIVHRFVNFHLAYSLGMFFVDFHWQIIVFPLVTFLTNWISRQLSPRVNYLLSPLIACAAASLCFVISYYTEWGRCVPQVMAVAIAVAGAVALYAALTYSGPRFPRATAISARVLRWLGGIPLPNSQPSAD